MTDLALASINQASENLIDGGAVLGGPLPTWFVYPAGFGFRAR